MLFNVMVHVHTNPNRAGHAEILRENLDRAVGDRADHPPLHGHERGVLGGRASDDQMRCRSAGSR